MASAPKSIIAVYLGQITKVVADLEKELNADNEGNEDAVSIEVADVVTTAKARGIMPFMKDSKTLLFVEYDFNTSKYSATFKIFEGGKDNNNDEPLDSYTVDFRDGTNMPDFLAVLQGYIRKEVSGLGWAG